MVKSFILTFFILSSFGSFATEIISKDLALKLGEDHLVKIYGESVLKERPLTVVEGVKSWQFSGKTVKVEVDRFTGKILKYSKSK